MDGSAHQDFATAFNSYITDVQPTRAYEALDVARAEYERATRAARIDHDQQERVSQAFRAYRCALKHAFGIVELERLDPALISAIGRSMLAIARHAEELQSE
jgi:hypothetical protein